ncbi:dnaJ subfamily C member 7-like isoform X2 [Leptotrombidium deliense]|uniref:DnaJ subfamily C member 7-like isoform X2 n=1 Tax=Leptotrombidium deliense TaxID=299467 RepID=A0A443SA10_9ACAR|nr:dnaJ subfamily C member 7-like isoform X2 [Leptotrombidium deliense]
MDPRVKPSLLLASDANGINEIGVWYFREQRYEEAKKRFTEAINLSPKNVAYYHNRGCCFAAMQRFEDALKDAEKCVEIDPKFVKGFELQIDCHIVLGNLRSAQSSLLDLCKCTSHDWQFFESRNGLVNSLFSYVNDYNRFMQIKDYASALNVIDTAMKSSAFSFALKLMKAETLLCIKRYVDATNITNDVLKNIPNNLAALYIRGKCYFLQEKFDEAIENFEAVLCSYQHDEVTSILKKTKIKKAKKDGSDAMKFGNYARAYNIYTEALFIDSSNNAENSKIYFNRSIASDKLGNTNQAIQDCSEAIKLDNRYLKAFLKRAKLCFDVKMFHQSAKDYEQCYQIDNNPEYLDLQKQTMAEIFKSQLENT